MIARFIKRLAMIAILGWALGFAWFAMLLPQPLDKAAVNADAVVVLTGGTGRINRGLEALDRGWAGKMFVSGVDRDVKLGEFAAEYHVTEARMKCCVELGFESVDTRSNALETARWVADNKARRIRLVTTDWHMPRAAFELERMLPKGTVVDEDAVVSAPSLRVLLKEYHKYLARWITVMLGV